MLALDKSEMWLLRNTESCFSKMIVKAFYARVSYTTLDNYECLTWKKNGAHRSVLMGFSWKYHKIPYGIFSYSKDSFLSALTSSLNVVSSY